MVTLTFCQVEASMNDDLNQHIQHADKTQNTHRHKFKMRFLICISEKKSSKIYLSTGVLWLMRQKIVFSDLVNICLMYVNVALEVCEEFVGFV